MSTRCLSPPAGWSTRLLPPSALRRVREVNGPWLDSSWTVTWSTPCFISPPRPETLRPLRDAQLRRDPWRLTKRFSKAGGGVDRCQCSTPSTDIMASSSCRRAASVPVDELMIENLMIGIDRSGEVDQRVVRSHRCLQDSLLTTLRGDARETLKRAARSFCRNLPVAYSFRI